MRNIFFEKSLQLEVNVIGYHEQGESIVFFIKADGNIVYTGIVDCYKTKEQNIVRKILEEERVEKVDFICWTHPHDDHTVGFDEIWDQYCTKETCFCCTDIAKAESNLYSDDAMAVFRNMLKIQQESRKRKKIRIKYLKDATQAERLRCVRNNVQYEFRIHSFAPNSAMLGERIIEDKEARGNVYSIGLFLFFGEYSIMLAGDVENPVMRRIDDGDIEYPVDYIKIPHHGSVSADFLPDKLKNLSIKPPSIAITTLFRKHKLPRGQVIDKYFKWGCGEVYATGNIEESSSYNWGYGIVKTTFDILEENEYIETKLIGDALPYGREQVG